MRGVPVRSPRAQASAGHSGDQGQGQATTAGKNTASRPLERLKSQPQAGIPPSPARQTGNAAPRRRVMVRLGPRAFGRSPRHIESPREPLSTRSIAGLRIAAASSAGPPARPTDIEPARTQLAFPRTPVHHLPVPRAVWYVRMAGQSRRIRRHGRCRMTCRLHDGRSCNIASVPPRQWIGMNSDMK